MKKTDFFKGLKEGIPIALAYLSVSFTFGIMAISQGLYWWQALLISMLTLTSAGQLAGIQGIGIPYIDMLVTQLTINVRYAFMSVSLSQKLDERFRGIFKWLLGFFITDEIFAVAISKNTVTRSFFLGLGFLPYFGWAIGTLLGSILGSVFPEIVMNALSIAIYGMFVSIIMPVCKKDKRTLLVVLVAAIISMLLYYIPLFSKLSGGLMISICAVISAVFGALIFPRKKVEEDAS